MLIDTKPGWNSAGDAVLEVTDLRSGTVLGSFKLRYLRDTNEVVLLKEVEDGDEAVYSEILPTVDDGGSSP